MACRRSGPGRDPLPNPAVLEIKAAALRAAAGAPAAGLCAGGARPARVRLVALHATVIRNVIGAGRAWGPSSSRSNCPSRSHRVKSACGVACERLRRLLTRRPLARSRRLRGRWTSVNPDMQAADEQARLTRRGFRLEYASMAWMTVEAAVAIASSTWRTVHAGLAPPCPPCMAPVAPLFHPRPSYADAAGSSLHQRGENPAPPVNQSVNEMRRARLRHERCRAP